MAEDGHRRLDLVIRPCRRQVAIQDIDGLARGLLQSADCSLQNPAPGQSIRGLELWLLKPVSERALSNAGLCRRGFNRGFREQPCNGNVLLSAQPFAVTWHAANCRRLPRDKKGPGHRQAARAPSRNPHGTAVRKQPLEKPEGLRATAPR